jgi:hypothetical protein
MLNGAGDEIEIEPMAKLEELVTVNDCALLD